MPEKNKKATVAGGHTFCSTETHSTGFLLNLQAECLKHMEGNNLPLELDIIADGRPHRYSKDDKPREKDEWYIAWEGKSTKGIFYLICIYGSWSENSKYEFKSWEQDKFKSNFNFDETERKELHEAIKRRRQEAETALTEERDNAAKRAKEIWKSASKVPPQKGTHARYIEIKGIQPYGVRYEKNPWGHDSIVIPLKNIEGDIRSLQFISVGDNGKVYKSFLSRGEKRGNFFFIGGIKNGEPYYVGEGYATCASVHETTGIPVVVAFDSGNLEPVIGNLRKIYDKNEITIAGDFDKNGTGQKAAEEAAKMHACKVVFPTFPNGKEYNGNGEKRTDFNDLHQVCGLEEVKRQLENAKVVPTLQEELRCLATDLLKKEEPCERFSTSVLPECLREYITSIAETTNADPIMITCSVLATVSSFVKRKIYISENDYFQTLFPNLWMLNITKSGGFKTTALNKGARLAWKKSEEVHRSVKELEERISKENENKKEREDLVAQKYLKSLENPLLPGKITSEALMEHLGQGHGGMILTSEFGAWLQNLEKSHNSDLKQLFTDLYDVPPFFHYKTKTVGEFLLEKPFITICGVSTLTWIKENLKPGDVSSGFFARFLLFTPPHNEEIPPARPLKSNLHNLDVESRIHDTLRFMDERREYKFTKSSGPYFDDLHRSIYEIPKQYSESCQEILDPYLKRWSPYLLKLAMLIRLFEDPLSSELSDTSLYSSMEILKVAIKSTAKLFEGELGESRFQKNCRVVFEWILKRRSKGKSTTYGDIISSNSLKGEDKDYETVLKHLVNSGRLREVTMHPIKKTDYLPLEVEKDEKS